MRRVTWEDHAEFRVGDATVEFGVDEVADTDEEDADRDNRNDDVGDFVEAHFFHFRENAEGDDDAERSSVEGHSAFPDAQNFTEVREIEFEVEKENVADSSPEDHAEQHREHEIWDEIFVCFEPPLFDEFSEEEVADREGEEVHEAVPVNGNGTDVDNDRIDVGVGEHGCL